MKVHGKEKKKKKGKGKRRKRKREERFDGERVGLGGSADRCLIGLAGDHVKYEQQTTNNNQTTSARCSRASHRGQHATLRFLTLVQARALGQYAQSCRFGPARGGLRGESSPPLPSTSPATSHLSWLSSYIARHLEICLTTSRRNGGAPPSYTVSDTL